jgi:hypothetical protein
MVPANAGTTAPANTGEKPSCDMMLRRRDDQFRSTAITACR